MYVNACRYVTGSSVIILFINCINRVDFSSQQNDSDGSWCGRGDCTVTVAKRLVWAGTSYAAVDTSKGSPPGDK